jgi:hypothetical protein
MINLVGTISPTTDLTNPDLTGFVLPMDAKRYIEYYHAEIIKIIENRLEGTWRVVAIEERSEMLRKAMIETCRDESPVYTLDKILGTFDIVAVENGPLARMADSGVVAIPRRKLRLKAELQDGDEGTLKIVESDVEAMKRRYL